MTSLPPCSTKSSLKSFSNHRSFILRRRCGLCLTGWPMPPSWDSIKPAWTRWDNPAFYRECILCNLNGDFKIKGYSDNVTFSLSTAQRCSLMSCDLFCAHAEIIFYFRISVASKVGLAHLYLLIQDLVTEDTEVTEVTEDTVLLPKQWNLVSSLSGGKWLKSKLGSQSENTKPFCCCGLGSYWITLCLGSQFRLVCLVKPHHEETVLDAKAHVISSTFQPFYLTSSQLSVFHFSKTNKR